MKKMGLYWEGIMYEKNIGYCWEPMMDENIWILLEDIMDEKIFGFLLEGHR